MSLTALRLSVARTISCHGADACDAPTRLPSLRPEALFVWGRRDKLVPIAFKRHVVDALPQATHVELDCGHVPQVERPRQCHAAIGEFLEEESRAMVAGA